MNEPKRIRTVFYTISSLVNFALSLIGPIWMLRMTEVGYSLRVVAVTAPLMLLKLPAAGGTIDGGGEGPGREVEAL